MRNSVMPGARMLKMVTMKLMAPSSDDAPARCSAKIAMSTAGPGCEPAEDSGGYRGQPVAAPSPVKEEPSSRKNDGTNNQKLMLFMRGNAMSGAPIKSGTNQLPKPPIKAGMTRKNTMNSAWAVSTTL